MALMINHNHHLYDKEMDYQSRFTHFLMDKLDVSKAEAVKIAYCDNRYLLFIQRAFNKNIEIDWEYFKNKIIRRESCALLSLNHQDVINNDVCPEYFHNDMSDIEIRTLVELKETFDLKFNIDLIVQNIILSEASCSVSWNLPYKSLKKYKKYFKDMLEFDDTLQLCTINFKSENLSPLVKYNMSKERKAPARWLKYPKKGQERLLKLFANDMIAVPSQYISYREKKDKYNSCEAIFDKLAKIDLKFSNKFVNFLREHKVSNLFNLLIHKRVDARVAMDILNAVRKEYKKNKSFVGMVEDYSNAYQPDFDAVLIRGPVTVKSVMSFFHDEFHRRKLQDSKRLVDPVRFINFPFEDSVKELTSTWDLKVEGGEMNHCVGGYRPSNYSRFFHINHNGNRSTIHLVRRASVGGLVGHPRMMEGGRVTRPGQPGYRDDSGGLGRWVISQHRSFANGNINDEHEGIGKMLMEYLNSYCNK